MSYVLAIDQGTTSSRAILFSEALEIAAIAQQEFPQSFPAPGLVEHDPEAIWQSVLAVGRDALRIAGADPAAVAAIGITNQRETALVWDRNTGQPIHPAIVWQDRRGAGHCRALAAGGHEALVKSRTGLLLDPYFSATKIAWLLDNVEGARSRAERGQLAFGTVDTFLLWRLTGGAVHATDATNASRTMLYDIHRGAWDDELLALFGIPRSMLPAVLNSADDYGMSLAEHFGRPVPIRGVAGDQQAAMIGEACFAAGMLKATYGTGCFALLNTGDMPVLSQHRLLTTIAYQFDGKPTYALEGSIFVAGAAIQWLRDGLGIIATAEQSGALAAVSDPHQDIYLVPAFVGLGAPYWDPGCRGALFGLTRSTGPAELAKAALESVCYQTHDLLNAMRADWPSIKLMLRADGGMAASDWMLQRLADILDVTVERAAVRETTALGAAYLAGFKHGIYPPPSRFADLWRAGRAFTPAMMPAIRAEKIAGWHDAVSRTLTKTTNGGKR
ncbi:MAG: glycerol kinase GlpK [Alphaproteobacteria bacterium]|nr:glycerol kinase GlpK [Alphaproteobacteria bacterium]